MSEKSKILVVEDNDFVRMQIVSYLKEADFEVAEATDGREGLDYMVDHQDEIAAAIVDIRMEPVGGFDFVRSIRGKGIEAPVVFVTGDQTADILEQSGKLGVGAVLMKPVMKERLVKAVERVIRKAK